MKKRYLYCALMSAFIAFTSCQDDVIENIATPWQEGEGITFGARTGYESDGNDSRTIYSGKKYQHNGKTYERVDWVLNDEIGVYCEQANNPLPIVINKTIGNQIFSKNMGPHYGEYKVVGGITPGTPVDQDENYSFAQFVKSGNASLQWGAQTPHTFYAVYPSVNQNYSMDIKGNTVEGRIAVDQTPYEIVPDNNGGYIARPTMRQSYMVAKQTVDPTLGNASVNLTFQSIVTALEIELVGSAASNTEEGNNITGIQIQSKSHNIAGAFTCNLDVNNTDGYPKCEEQTKNADGSVIEGSKSIRLGLKDPVTKESLKLEKDKKLKVTFFMLPVNDLSDLSITVYGLKGSTTRPLNEKGQASAPGLNFIAHKKHYIANLSLPNGFTTNNWISRLQDNVLLSQLSIPGTGNSCSSQSVIEKDSTALKVQTQSLSLEEQWNMGIRCFEIMSTFASDETSHSRSKDLGDAFVRTSKLGIATYYPSQGTNQGTKPQAQNLQVRTAYNKIAELLNRPENAREFAVVIFTYQPLHAQRKNSSAKTYLTQLENFLAGNTYQRIAYDPNLTVQDCRGKIMVIARPTSEGEDEGTVAPGRNDYLLIDGWGSLQDKWRQRGYKTPSGDKVQNNGRKAGVDPKQTVEYSLMKLEDYVGWSTEDHNKEIAPFVKDSTLVDYTYTVKSSTMTNAYVQEWPRVVRESTAHNIFLLYSTVGGSYKIQFQWQSSYNEKLSDAQHAYEKSIKDSNHSMLYINSLCGYYVDETSDDSRIPLYKYNFDGVIAQSWGTSYGDYKSFADDINRDFYTRVLKKQGGHTTGPMGIIMMNFVGDSKNEASCLMPGVVVANNFSFPLQTKVTNQ